MAETIVSASSENALPQKECILPTKHAWDLPRYIDDGDPEVGFALTGSAINSDLATAAECEQEHDFNLEPGDDQIATDMLTSPMVAQLIAQYERDLSVFSAHCEQAPRIPFALLHLIQRAYMAGRYSRSRLAPKSARERASSRAERRAFELMLKEARRG
jgi:hypothetical protein